MNLSFIKKSGILPAQMIENISANELAFHSALDCNCVCCPQCGQCRCQCHR